MPTRRRTFAGGTYGARGLYSRKKVPSRRLIAGMGDENPPVRIPQDEEGVHEIAEEGDEDEQGMTEEQLENIAEAQAWVIGEL